MSTNDGVWYVSTADGRGLRVLTDPALPGSAGAARAMAAAQERFGLTGVVSASQPDLKRFLGEIDLRGQGAGSGQQGARGTGGSGGTGGTGGAELRPGKVVNLGEGVTPVVPMLDAEAERLLTRVVFVGVIKAFAVVALVQFIAIVVLVLASGAASGGRG